MRRMRWDLYGRVVDNLGDVGVCWRLAADLAARGQSVRLRLDDRSALGWMAPHGAPGVQLLGWDDAAAPGDVVVEAFGCELPAAVVDAMAARMPHPVWLNLEYLSAEPYVARSHGLASPVAASRGLAKWFYFPGFDEASGGLLREPGLLEERAAFDGGAWLAARGWALREGERAVSVFCYGGAPLARWLPLLAAQPTLLLATPGPATTLLRAAALPAGLRVVELPWLTQADYDRLLWACALNLVRGEDSFVRAMWAGRPFLWQAYVQADGVHETKVDAFVERFVATAPPPLAASVRAALRRWNGFDDAPPALPDAPAWDALCLRWRARLAAQRDLTAQLMSFAGDKRTAAL